MAAVQVLREEETDRGWSHRVAVEEDAGPTREHTVTLSWADHDHLCGGRFAPSRVVEVIVRFVYEHPHARPVPEAFDVATARRWYPGLDAAVLGSL